jgi:hypothetical protein
MWFGNGMAAHYRTLPAERHGRICRSRLSVNMATLNTSEKERHQGVEKFASSTAQWRTAIARRWLPVCRRISPDPDSIPAIPFAVIVAFATVGCRSIRKKPLAAESLRRSRADIAPGPPYLFQLRRPSLETIPNVHEWNDGTGGTRCWSSTDSL